MVKSLSFAVTLALVGFSSTLQAQNINDIRWKSESHVRSVYGEPNSIQGPIGTHASYQLWKYDGFTVAFSNNRAFHLFSTGSSVELQEER